MAKQRQQDVHTWRRGWRLHLASTEQEEPDIELRWERHSPATSRGTISIRVDNERCVDHLRRAPTIEQVRANIEELAVNIHAAKVLVEGHDVYPEVLKDFVREFLEELS